MDQPLSTKSKRAAEHFKTGQNAFNLYKFDEAEDALLTAIKEDTNFIEAHLLLGYMYEGQGKNQPAISQYKRALNINPNAYPEIFFSLAKLELKEGEYSDALADFKESVKTKSKDATIEYYKQNGIASCLFAMEALKHPVPYDPKNVGPNINSKFDEYFPAITNDDGMFLFTRDIQDNSSMYGHQEDFFVSYKVDNDWTTAVNLGPPLNTADNEGAPTLSADGHILIYAGCDRPDGHGSCDLYYSIRYGKQWTKGKNLGLPINTRNWESQPSLSSDGKTLYFIRGSITGRGTKDQDIYMTQLNDSGKWSMPEKLSDTINSPGREESVQIAPDNQTLYFSSDGHPGMGGLDIFVSHRLPNGRWGIPKNLGYPINTSKDDNSFYLDPNGHTVYFSSDRPGGFGGLDFYSYELYDSARPQPITYVKGKVYNAKNNQPLMAYFTLTDLSTGNVIVKSTSAQDDGTFLVTLPLNKNYALDVSKKGYLFYSENFSLQNVAASAAEPYTMDIPLQPIDTGAKIVLKNIFYETDKFNLKQESQIELNKLVTFLQTNPTVRIEISGHTDNTGSTEHNLTLSKNRAKSVYDYLVAHSISADRLTYKGYGPSMPIADNNTEAGKARNRRTELKITGK
jgi:outer membrane protein OmpA-like peptidoglycan-associated protein